MDRSELGEAVAARLRSEESSLREQFVGQGGVHAFVLDDVLDPEVCRAIHAAFPDPGSMMLRSTVREHKYVSAQMDRHAPLLEEVVYAFQHEAVVTALGRIAGVASLMPDEHLYAGGLSLMTKGQFLNPHLDNSHDKDRSAYRVLNLLFYVTPDWRAEYGGSLQLWDADPRRTAARTIPSLFNRLVVMGTTPRSWHAVSPVVHDGARCCVSNYYFAPRPLGDRGADPEHPYFHPTVFRGFPGEPVKDLVLRADALVRTGVRRLRRGGLAPLRHVYERS